jgi:hypothetical protein
MGNKGNREVDETNAESTSILFLPID